MLSLLFQRRVTCGSIYIDHNEYTYGSYLLEKVHDRSIGRGGGGFSMDSRSCG